MRKNRGFTLIELLISIGITAAVTVGLVEVLSIGLSYNEHLRTGQTTELNRIQFEDRLTEMLQHIYVDPVNNANPSTYFVGQTGGGQPPGQTVVPGETISATTPAGGATGGLVAPPSGAGGAAGSGGDADTLMFTIVGRKPSAAALASTDDFETNNRNFGPQGGLAEIEISTTAVGDAQGKQGIVLRQQFPADQDATQGGFETIIEPEATRVSFEFYDGTAWQSTWNTFAQTTRQLPSAIRVTYTMPGETQDRVFIVGIPLSNVTPLAPATQTGGS